MLSKRWIAAFAIGALSLSGQSNDARAHPHIWIDVQGVILFENERIAGVRFTWTFDEFFSAGVIGEFDKNRNDKFDADEIEPLRTGAFEGVKEAGYFTDIRIDDAKFAIETTTDFAAEIVKGAAVYHFTVPLAEPLDPARTAFSVSAYDASYYVDAALAEKNPVRIEGNGGVGCTVRVFSDRDNPLYYGVIFPQKAELQCPPPR